MSDRIKNWWRIHGDLAAHIPKPVWDELDAAIRADERQRTSPPHDPSVEEVVLQVIANEKNPHLHVRFTPDIARRIVAMGRR